MEGRLKREEIYIYTHRERESYDWLVLLYSRSQHNIVKKLSPNLKKTIQGKRKEVVPHASALGLGLSGTSTCISASKIVCLRSTVLLK